MKENRVDKVNMTERNGLDLLGDLTSWDNPHLFRSPN